MLRILSADSQKARSFSAGHGFTAREHRFREIFKKVSGLSFNMTEQMKKTARNLPKAKILLDTGSAAAVMIDRIHGTGVIAAGAECAWLFHLVVPLLRSFF